MLSLWFNAGAKNGGGGISCVYVIGMNPEKRGGCKSGIFRDKVTIFF